MRRGRRSAQRRAARLVRCYPATWRERYADEFVQLLIDDISERPRSPRRTADVLRAGALARLTNAGLTERALEPEAQIRAGLAASGLAIAGFLVLGIAIWSQLTIGWQWSEPSAPQTTVAMLMMSGAVACLLAVLVLAAAPIAWALCRVIRQGISRGLRLRLAASGAGAAVLILGSHHFGAAWPGTGGHPWAHSGLVPGSVAALGWASTLWVTSYWAHPAALSSFPVAEIVWMVGSPLALLSLVIGTAGVLRRLPLTRRVLRYETRLAAAAALAMAGFLAGAASWVISGGPGPRGLFRVGTIDDVGIAVMASALVLAFRAAQRAQAAFRAVR
jgi:hypothetical protein